MEKRIVIDDRMESYRSFFDHEWSKAIHELAEGTTHEEIVFDLARSWKGAANTHVMPWLMAQQLKHFYAGVMQQIDPEAMTLLNGLLFRLGRERGLVIPENAVQQLRGLLHQTAIELGRKRKQLVGEFEPQDAWKQFLHEGEFQFSVWGSQRIVYGAMYYAYEDFLLRCFRLASGDRRYEIPGKQFAEDFGKTFGMALRDECWSNPVVTAARLTRNALVHNGGRVTEKLEKVKHGLRIEDNEIQIMPDDTKRLFDHLKVSAYHLVELAARGQSKTGNST